MEIDNTVREHVLNLLSGRGAYVGFEDAIRDLPEDLRGQKHKDAPHTLWQLLEHMRIAQWDIVEFSHNPAHVSPEFPKGYWPVSAGPGNDDAWNASVTQFRKDLRTMQNIVKDPATDLYAPIPHGDGQTVLREALLVADHNAYHLGQFVFLRRLLGAWSE
jgi:hypothetical protein